MTARKDSCTAVLFLAGLLAAILYLALGTVPQVRGFEERLRPAHAPRYDKSAVLERMTGELEEREREELAAAALRTPLRSMSKPLAPTLPSYEEAMDLFTRYTQDSDQALNALLDRDHLFIELYGGIQRLMGRRISEDVDPQYTVVRLQNGQLSFSDPDSAPMDMTVRAEEMVEFVRRVRREFKVPVLYVQAPSKLSISSLPEGLSDHTEEEADQFLALLEEARVDTLDLRPAFRAVAEKDRSEAEELFFQTDHHWTPAGAFLGYQVLCEKLTEDFRFRIDKKLTDPDSFHKYDFGQVFLGSQGRRVGSAYGGLDDLEIWSPKWNTHFTYTAALAGVDREGPFVTSLLFPERLARVDLYNDNPYAIYAGGDYLLSQAVNEDLPLGRRVLVLRDSFGCGLTPFLSLCCGEVMAMDPRQFNGNQDIMMHYIDWLEPDLILVLNTTGSLQVDKLFPYLPTGRENSLAQRRLETPEKGS